MDGPGHTQRPNGFGEKRRVPNSSEAMRYHTKIPCRKRPFVGRYREAPSPHYSRIQLANNAGLKEPLAVGGPGRIERRRYTVTLHPFHGRRDGYPVRLAPGILRLQAGIATGQVSPDYSRAFRE